EKVKWSSGKVAGAEYLADEDDAFRDDVLGYGEIKTALEEEVERLADESSAGAWSTAGDQMEGEGGAGGKGGGMTAGGVVGQCGGVGLVLVVGDDSIRTFYVSVVASVLY